MSPELNPTILWPSVNPNELHQYPLIEQKQIYKRPKTTFYLKKRATTTSTTPHLRGGCAPSHMKKFALLLWLVTKGIYIFNLD